MEYTVKDNLLLVACGQFFEAAAVNKAEDTNHLRDMIMETGVKKIFLVVGNLAAGAVDDPAVNFVRPSQAPAALLNPNLLYLVGNKAIDSELELHGATWDDVDEAAAKELEDMCAMALADLEVAGGEIDDVEDEEARAVLEWFEDLPEISFVEAKVAAEEDVEMDDAAAVLVEDAMGDNLAVVVGGRFVNRAVVTLACFDSDLY